MLRLENASASYDGKPALHNISLSVDAGEKVCVMGQSGSGKSTLLHMLYDQLRDSAALVPQSLGLVDRLSVFHNVFMANLSRHSLWFNVANLLRPMSQPKRDILPILEQLGMHSFWQQSAGTLSGGQRQRVAVARALYQAQSARALIADEPISALDPSRSRQVMSALTETYQTAIFVLHDTELAMTYADRIIAIKQGEIVLDKLTNRLSEHDLQELN